MLDGMLEVYDKAGFDREAGAPTATQPCLVAVYNNEDGTREVADFATIEQRNTGNPDPSITTPFNICQKHSRMLQVAYLAVKTRFRKGGIGARILNILNESWDHLGLLHAWKTQRWGRGWARNPAFDWYLKIGFTVTDSDNFTVPGQAGTEVEFHTFERCSLHLPDPEDDDDGATVVHDDDESDVPVASSQSPTLNGGGVAPADFTMDSLNGHIVTAQYWRNNGAPAEVFVFVEGRDMRGVMHGIQVDPLPVGRVDGFNSLLSMSEIIADHGPVDEHDLGKYPPSIAKVIRWGIQSAQVWAETGVYRFTRKPDDAFSALPPHTELVLSGDTGSSMSTTHEIE